MRGRAAGVSLDTFTTTVEAAAAMAREDPYDDRPTLGELADRCPRCGLRPTWVHEDVCEDCRTAVGADCRYDEEAGW